MNETGRPLKYKSSNNRIYKLNASVPPFFIGTYLKFKEFAQTFTEPGLEIYARTIEGMDVSAKGRGRMSVLVRYLITKFMLENGPRQDIPTSESEVI